MQSTESFLGQSVWHGEAPVQWKGGRRPKRAKTSLYSELGRQRIGWETQKSLCSTRERMCLERQKYKKDKPRKILTGIFYKCIVPKYFSQIRSSKRKV